jgi:Flavoprotein
LTKSCVNEMANAEDLDGDSVEGRDQDIYLVTEEIQQNLVALPCRRCKHVLLSTESALFDEFFSPLARNSSIELRLISNEPLALTAENAENGTLHHMDVLDGCTLDKNGRSWKWRTARPIELCEWADVFVVAPIDAGTLGSMITGLTTTLTLSVLRSWNSAKSVILVPGMTLSEWNNPLTNRQLNEIKQYWPWTVVTSPVLWKFSGFDQMVRLPWSGLEKFHEALSQILGLTSVIEDSIETNGRVHDMSEKGVSPGNGDGSKKPGRNDVTCAELYNPHARIEPETQGKHTRSLPLELWFNIIECQLGDWEIAKAVGIPTNLPAPKEWQSHILQMSTSASLEYTILRGSFASIKSRIDALPRHKVLSDLACNLIYKFTRTDILSYLSDNYPHLIRKSVRLMSMPYRASAIYGNPDILTWWRNSAVFSAKDYLADAVDGASRAGFINVLEWWRLSGLPLKYTERALQYASTEGHVSVLKWWKNASENASISNPIPLKVGKSVRLAAQSGSTASLAWWDASGIPYSHSESVARIASTYGHVHVLELWHRLRGSKMIFDNQVLVGATKNGHDEILEWWRSSGLRVEFKTCDIEEALEDADPISGAEERVRRWWARNGLNLGVGPSEWMRVKVLG